MTEGRQLIIPCRVTSPNVTVTLKKVRLNNITPGVVLASNGCCCGLFIYLFIFLMSLEKLSLWASQ
jgi:hypothetical protein